MTPQNAKLLTFALSFCTFIFAFFNFEGACLGFGAWDLGF
jgi:hypothetical protein